MINSRNLLPVFEAYVKEYKNKNFSLSECDSQAIIRFLDQGYVYVKNMYNPRTKKCGCFVSNTMDSNEVMYIYIFEFAYSLVDGKLSYGEYKSGNSSEQQSFVETYVKALIVADGNGDY